MFKIRHAHQPSKLNGARPDGAPWRRHKDDAPRCALPNSRLLTALAWVHSRASDRKLGRRKWTTQDQATTDAVEARAWGFGELQNLALWSTPSWFTLLELPQRSVGYERFLAFLLRAYRARAVGTLLSYEECMALTGVRSRATWRAWCRQWEAAGLVRIVQTWRLEGGRLCYGRLLYRIGPAFEDAAGPGLCEGACDAEGGLSAAWSKRIAVGLRRKARDARRQAKRRAWQACRPGEGTPDPPAQGEVPDREPQPSPDEPSASAGGAGELPRAPSSSGTCAGGAGGSRPSETEREGPLLPSGSSVIALQSATTTGADKALPLVVRNEKVARLPPVACSSPPGRDPPAPPAHVPELDGARGSSPAPPAEAEGDDRSEARPELQASFVAFTRGIAAANDGDPKAQAIARRLVEDLDQADEFVEDLGAEDLDGVALLEAFTDELAGQVVDDDRARARRAGELGRRHAEAQPVCPSCRGTGGAVDVACTACGGAGYVLPDWYSRPTRRDREREDDPC